MTNYYKEFNIDPALKGDALIDAIRQKRREWMFKQNSAPSEKLRYEASEKIALLEEFKKAALAEPAPLPQFSITQRADVTTGSTQTIQTNETTQTNEITAASKKGHGRLITIIVIILLFIVVVQAVIVYLMVPKPQYIDSSSHAAMETAANMGDLTDDMPIEAVVNIAGTGGERFFKCAIIFEYDGKNGVLGAELRHNAKVYKDMLIDHMSRLTLMEVTEPQARDKMRKDLVRLINHTLRPEIGQIRDVFFTEYVIQ